MSAVGDGGVTGDHKHSLAGRRVRVLCGQLLFGPSKSEGAADETEQLRAENERLKAMLLAAQKEQKNSVEKPPTENRAAPSSPEPSTAPNELNFRPLKGPNGGFGIEVLNLDLRKCDKETVTEQLLPLVKEWGLVVVRGTEKGIEGLRMAEFSSWMSPIGHLYTNHEMHEKQPTPLVFRLSNDENEGVQGGGATSKEPLWHHDSMHMPEPPIYQVLHMPMSPAWGEGKGKSEDLQREGEAAATWFARADASKLDEKTRARLLKLHTFNLPTGQQHPLLNLEKNIMIPPTQAGVLEVDFEAGTQKKLSKPELYHVMAGYRKLLLLGEPFTFDDVGKLGEDQTPTNSEEMTEFTKRLEAEALRTQSKSIHRHVFRPGDIVIQDNWSVAHRAPTSEEREYITGTRVLHRCLALSEKGGTGGA